MHPKIAPQRQLAPFIHHSSIVLYTAPDGESKIKEAPYFKKETDHLKLSRHTTGRKTMEAFHRMRMASMMARGNFQMPKTLPTTAQALSQMARKATEKKW